ncbi:hypothetical protein [Rodentibacter ratti]|uniref:Uncharacterized protein n=1 Tax=Rodentibacter ratti TaxID=1906745 RepID=A0A1V3L6Y9_9PAST|nr:hypothetical protein [Rodentibacter ratti]OOF85709.1 hypothetical protein BKG88_06920 [Rodentibacter ratti]
MNLYDFQKLLLNRNEIEQALGINLTLDKTLTFDEQDLDDYAMFSTIPIESATAIFLGINPRLPNQYKKHPRYWTVFNAVETAVRRGEINAEITQDFDINGNEIQFDISLTHDTAKAWAKTHGLKWGVPPYRPIILSDKDLEFNQSTTDTEKDEIIEDLRTQNTELKVRIAELESQPQKQNAVNYDDFSIYGHTSENLEHLFHIAMKISNKCDPDNLYSYPTEQQIKNYLTKYSNVSGKVAQAIYSIITPEKVKFRGKKPEGVETFRGFI